MSRRDFSPAEFELVTETLLSLAMQKSFTRLDVVPEVDPYLVIFIGLLPIFEQQAKDDRRELVFAATRSPSSAKLKQFEFRVFSNLRYVLWGDLVQESRRQRGVVKKLMIIGDLDFPDDSESQYLSSSDGSIDSAEIRAFVGSLANDNSFKGFVFHRQGWRTPFALEPVTPEGAEAVGKTTRFFKRLLNDDPK